MSRDDRAEDDEVGSSQLTPRDVIEQVREMDLSEEDRKEVREKLHAISVFGFAFKVLEEAPDDLSTEERKEYLLERYEEAMDEF